MSIAFRALKNPEHGGHIERWLGTFNEEIHELPGKRLKPHKIGDHDLKADSAYTLRELEYHIAMYITGVYNQSFHSGISCAPIKRWKDAISGDGKKPGMGLPKLPLNEQRLRLDLMPFEVRSIQRTYGIQIADVRYYDDVLRRYTGRVPALRTIVRYDPRDMRSVYFWDPELSKYFEIGYGNIARPSISLWEMRAVRKHLIDTGLKDINEELIFKTYEKLREHQEAAEKKTKIARTNIERRRALKHEPKPRLAPKPDLAEAQASAIEPPKRPNLTVVPSPKRFEHIQLLQVDDL